MARELLFLGLLRHQEMHGYQLNEFIQKDLAVCTNIKRPTAYYLLKKMAEKGWIRKSSKQIGNRPPRQVYQITTEGEAAFQSKLRDAMQHYSPAFFEDDIPLAYLSELKTEEALELLEKRRVVLLAELEMMRETSAHPGTIQWMLEHRLRHLETELDWLDEIISRLPIVEEK